ncbi:hypothetical protein HJC23_008356 [Cyclotella cryptica]|uniref:Uncharacterized protein n=1 Tax=Cyclotella cryptica TaxID=29204 RepID=A0ABD3Q6W3_9STRA|eukprot:CCRYP_008639-RA/>CCRYP_008639-RA protein AED:0.03 eAED:0.03 QI:216/1/1/1/1/1/2/208/409
MDNMMSFRGQKVASFLLLMLLTSIDAFAAVKPHFLFLKGSATAKLSSGRNNKIPSHWIRALALSSNGHDSDPPASDQREGMADAFAAFDSLTSDDLIDDGHSASSPESSSSGDKVIDLSDSSLLIDVQDIEEEDQVQKEIYSDMLADVPDYSGDVDQTATKEAIAQLQKVLDDAVARDTAKTAVLNDVDGIGNNIEKQGLTTADITRDILNQEIEPSLSMQDFMSSAVQEAMTEIEGEAPNARSLMEDSELRKEIEEIFDRAAEKLKSEVEEMKREQEAVTEEARKQGIEYIDSEKQRLSEAEASVSRLIQKVARETEEVQKAMEELERAKSEAGSGGGSRALEDSALDLKKGGIVKQSALVGALLFGSRAFTETILVLGSSNGGDHTMSALLQGAIALACAAYFFFVK